METTCKCPKCHATVKRTYYTECVGIVEDYINCDRCGYMYHMAYSDPVEGILPSVRKGFRLPNGKFVCKNSRRRARIHKKYGIKHSNNDWQLQFI